MTIRSRYVLTLCVTTLLLGAGAWGTFTGIRQVQGLLRETFALGTLVEDLLVLRVLTMEYDANPSGRIERQWGMKYDQIHATLDATPGIPTEVRDAFANMRELFNRVAEDHGQSGKAGNPAVHRLHAQLVSSLTIESSRISDWLKDYSADSRSRLMLMVRGYSLAAVGLLAFLTAFTGWMLLFTERRIVSSASALQEGAEAVARGDLDYRIQLAGKDEFAALAAVFNSMTQDLGHKSVLEARLAQSEKLEAMGTLAGGIAHDFNNLLNGIMGFTEMALMRTPHGSPAEKDLQEVMKASRRAADLVHQILAFSRLGDQEARPTQVRPIIAEALRLMRASIPTTVEIRSDLTADPTAVVDPGEIHRILVNLCTNAYLAMRDKGGLLEVGLGVATVEPGGEADRLGLPPGRYLTLVVSDTGTGMSPDVVARIFDPFFTTRGAGEGTGMGLSVVHGVVKKRGGTIAVRSQPGMGTTFTVYLPLAQEGAQAEPPPPEAVLGAGRILVVDDELLATSLLERQLTQLGYQVRAFTGSPAALAAFGQDPSAFDLVVTDLTMQGMAGDVLAFRLRGIRPDIPVLLVSAYSEGMTPERARIMGADEFLAKPFSVIDLSRAVHRLLTKA